MSRIQYSVGIVGYGLSAKIFHIPYVQSIPEFKLTAICQRTVTPTNNAANDHPGVEVFESVDHLVNSSQVDVVILCTPPADHFTQAKQCLEAGKHVVVEKPFCPTSEECAALVACSKKHNRLLTVFHNRRWDADYQTVLALLRSKTLGRIIDFESHFDRWSPALKDGWRNQKLPGQGVVYDLGAHLIDQIVFAFGMPKRVTGFIAEERNQSASGLEDACTILLHYDGMTATAKASAMSATRNQLRFWIRGDQGSFLKYHLDPQEPQLLGGMPIDDAQFGKEPIDHAGVLSLVDGVNIKEQTHPTVEPPTYGVFYKELANALTGGASVPVDAEDGLNVIYLIELARESAAKGQTLEVRQASE